MMHCLQSITYSLLQKIICITKLLLTNIESQRIVLPSMFVESFYVCCTNFKILSIKIDGSTRDRSVMATCALIGHTDNNYPDPRTPPPPPFF